MLCVSPAFFLQVKGRLHTTQTFVGRFSFFTPRGMAADGVVLRAPDAAADTAHSLPEQTRCWGATKLKLVVAARALLLPDS